MEKFDQVIRPDIVRPMSMPLNREGVDVTLRSRFRPGMTVCLKGFEKVYEPGRVVFSMGGSDVVVVFPGPGKKAGNIGWSSTLMLVPPEDLVPVIVSKKAKKAKKLHVEPR